MPKLTNRTKIFQIFKKIFRKTETFFEKFCFNEEVKISQF